MSNSTLILLGNRIVDMWNSLPFHVRSVSSSSSFKRSVINFLAIEHQLNITDIVYFCRSFLSLYIYFIAGPGGLSEYGVWVWGL